MRAIAVGILLLAALATGCGNDCETHDDCDDDDYCSEEDGEGACVPRKERGESCTETRECESGLTCRVEASQAAFGPTCDSPVLVDWGSACAVSPGAKTRSHLPWAYALLTGGLVLARRKRSQRRGAYGGLAGPGTEAAVGRRGRTITRLPWRATSAPFASAISTRAS
jgi:hypothetical protein